VVAIILIRGRHVCERNNGLTAHTKDAAQGKGTHMLEHILPRYIDNTYRGHRLALWLFVPILILKLLMSLGSIFIGERVARFADGIPLDSYTLAGASTVVTLFAQWGLLHLVIVLLCVLALFHYRAMVPFMFGLLLVEHLIRKQLILAFLPIVRVATTPSVVVNTALLVLMIAGLGLSLWRRGSAV